MWIGSRHAVAGERRATSSELNDVVSTRTSSDSRSRRRPRTCSRATWTVTEALLQPYGLLHGGAHCAVVGTLASVAAARWLGPEGRVVGTTNSTDFYRASKSGDRLMSVTKTAAPRTLATGLASGDLRRATAPGRGWTGGPPEPASLTATAATPTRCNPVVIDQLRLGLPPERRRRVPSGRHAMLPPGPWASRTLRTQVQPTLQQAAGHLLGVQREHQVIAPVAVDVQIAWPQALRPEAQLGHQPADCACSPAGSRPRSGATARRRSSSRWPGPRRSGSTPRPATRWSTQ